MNTESTLNSMPEGFCGTIQQYNELTKTFAKYGFEIKENTISLIPLDLRRITPLFDLKEKEKERLKPLGEILELLEFMINRKKMICVTDQWGNSCKIDNQKTVDFLIKLLKDNIPKFLRDTLNNEDTKRVLMRYDNDNLINTQDYQINLSTDADLFKWAGFIKSFMELSRKLYMQRKKSKVDIGEKAFICYSALIQYGVFNSTTTDCLDNIFKMKKPSIRMTNIIAEYACVYDCISIFDNNLQPNVLSNKDKYDQIKNWINAFIKAINRTIPYNTSKFVF